MHGHGGKLIETDRRNGHIFGCNFHCSMLKYVKSARRAGVQMLHDGEVAA